MAVTLNGDKSTRTNVFKVSELQEPTEETRRNRTVFTIGVHLRSSDPQALPFDNKHNVTRMNIPRVSNRIAKYNFSDKQVVEAHSGVAE